MKERIFDFDNHYYESEDALTGHQDRTLGNRGVRWADIDAKGEPGDFSAVHLVSAGTPEDYRRREREALGVTMA